MPDGKSPTPGRRPPPQAGTEPDGSPLGKEPLCPAAQALVVGQPARVRLSQRRLQEAVRSPQRRHESSSQDRPRSRRRRPGLRSRVAGPTDDPAGACRAQNDQKPRGQCSGTRTKPLGGNQLIAAARLRRAEPGPFAPAWDSSAEALPRPAVQSNAVAIVSSA